MAVFPPLVAPRRLMLRPDAPDLPDSVLRAMAQPGLDGDDPIARRARDEVARMLRAAFVARDARVAPIVGNPTAAAETCLRAVIEPGDRVLVGVSGPRGARIADMARRVGGQVTEATQPWGSAIDPATLRKAAGGRRHKAVCVVQGETSTGVLQPLGGLRGVANELGALLVVDGACLGGVGVDVDRNGVDVAIADAPGCLAGPPGLAPICLAPRALAALAARRAPITSVSLRLTDPRDDALHAGRPAPTTGLLYGLHEALRLALAEGLDERRARHERHGEALCAGLRAMGLTLPVPRELRLPHLVVVSVPNGVDGEAVRARLRTDHGVAIGAGTGPLAGIAWRIGLMGASSSRVAVNACLSALAGALRTQGFTPRADPVAAADARYR